MPGLAAPACRAYFRGVLRDLAACGFDPAWAVLNAADFGVPQKRRRLFVAGVRGGAFRFPDPTHGPTADRPHVSSGAVLIPRRPLGPPNLSKIVYAKRPDLRPRPWDGHLFNGGGRPINLAEPSPTILASAGGNKTHFLDIEGEAAAYHRRLLAGGAPRSGKLPGARRLTVAESALLQTFPPGMTFTGSRSSQYSQIGNAVPPRLAAAVGRALADQLADVAGPSAGRVRPAADRLFM